MTTMLMSDVMPAWQVADPVGHIKLTLVPLKQDPPQPRYQDYLLAVEAIEAGVLAVTEVSESGSVPELLAVSDADRPVLLIDGEELLGGKPEKSHQYRLPRDRPLNCLKRHPA